MERARIPATRHAGEGVALPSRREEPTEQEWDRFWNLSLDLLCLAGLDGYFRRLNTAWTTCLGWTLEKLTARPFLDFVHPDDRDATLAEVGRLAEGGPAVSFANRYRCQDGSYRWLEWNARTVPGRREIYATARDITRQKRLEQEVLQISDREQARLGRDLHDGLCQTLAGIAALSTTLSRRLEASAEASASAAATEIATLLCDAIGQARDLARGLEPVALQEGGLDEALEQLAVETARRFRISCTFASDRSIARLSQETKRHLFRMAQQAVQNAVSHAHAGRIEIGLSGQDGRGLLSVSDDGVGLPVEALRAGGIGLHTMAYRAGAINGRLAVQPRGGVGTAVTCAFPESETLDPGETAVHARHDI